MACKVTVLGPEGDIYFEGSLPTRQAAEDAKALLCSDDGLAGISDVLVANMVGHATFESVFDLVEALLRKVDGH